jgi:hypothetical protein
MRNKPDVLSSSFIFDCNKNAMFRKLFLFSPSLKMEFNLSGLSHSIQRLRLPLIVGFADCIPLPLKMEIELTS